MGNCLGSSPAVDYIRSSHQTHVPGRSVNSCLSQLVFECNNKDKSQTLRTTRSEGDILSSPNLKAFTFNELRSATRNFGPRSLIGEGGFGYVHKGWVDEQSLSATKPGNGLVVAVKKLKPESGWYSEVNYLGQLHHPNHVKLVGYCLDGDNRLLVYEYMPKGSLENHLFHRASQPVSWATRIKVAIDAARGLAFLHESNPQVIYRDFKASNVLLDSEFNAKLSDFGLAKAGPTGDRSHVSTQVMGTQGYAAPEYIATGRLTTRCDVYSFGVVLLELLSGRSVIDKTKSRVEQNLVEWAKSSFIGDKRKLFRIMDTKLEGQYPQRAAYEAAILALQCISDAKIRPQMSEVVTTLELLPVSRSSGQSWRSVPSSAGSSPLGNVHCLTESKSVSSQPSDSTVRSPLPTLRSQGG